MKIHLIAIGGSVMHNMALAMKNKGYTVTGSDDEINEPSRSRLQKQGLLPAAMGWFPEKLDKSYDAVILGMHARVDNPELLRAQELGLKIYSYPEYMYEMTKDKIRVVVGGSHGKTTITSMILHVLKHAGKDFDYLVGAQLQGFDTMVKLTKEAPIAVFEGDEYLASPIDRRPKFHLYKPHIAIVSGIAWDHINVFPTYENYVEQFEKFIHIIEPKGSLVYCTADNELKNLVEKTKAEVTKIPYAIPQNVIENGTTFLVANGKKIPLKIFGDHNLMNLNGARLVCEKLGIKDEVFYDAIQSFTGAAKR
ncbi:MAG: UDP-N-acetylmuramate--L-alanine ligase, partial [Bacteroidia bacterium]